MSAFPATRAPSIEPPGSTHDDAWAAARLPRHRAVGRRIAWIASSRYPCLSSPLTGAVVALYVTTDLPDIPPLAETTVLLDRDGNEVAKLHADVDRV